MPRPIHVPASTGGIATYTLNVHDAWTLLAVTFSLVPLAGAGADNFAWLDLRDPSGGIIYLQPLTPSDGGNMFYSLAVDAEPWVAEPYMPPGYPQYTDGLSYYYIMQRLSPQTLYSGCTLNVYKTLGSEAPPTDPITAVSPHYTIPDLHLWVQDASAPRELPPNPPPLLTYEAA